MGTLLSIELIGHSFPTIFSPGSRIARIGLQVKKEVTETYPFMGKSEVRFMVPMQVETSQDQGPARFKGEAVQGPASEPFLYLSWGDWTDVAWVMQIRTKIQLNQIPAELLSAALSSGRGLRAHLCLSDARGRPATGSLKAAQIEWALADGA